MSQARRLRGRKRLENRRFAGKTGLLWTKSSGTAIYTKAEFGRFLGRNTYNNDMSRQLTPDQESIVQSAMAKGLASSAEDFVSDALQSKLNDMEHESKVDGWLRNDVVPAFEDFLKNPSEGMTSEAARADILSD